MTDRDKLEKVKAEIERRYNYHKDHADDYAGTEHFWKADEDRGLLSFIYSMQEELTIPDIVDEHYWEMLGEEPVSEDFKEFEVEYFEREKDNIVCVYDRHAGLVAGAQWQKQQMMKEAVSGHVGQTINGMLRALSDETFGDMGFTAGDKVKLIIIKAD